MAAPMFPMASVKEDIMTRIPEVGLNQKSRSGRKKMLERKVLM